MKNHNDKSIPWSGIVNPVCFLTGFYYSGFVVKMLNIVGRKKYMRMILPSLKERRVVDRLLSSFFREYKPQDFKKAIAALSRFYHLKNPTDRVV